MSELRKEMLESKLELRKELWQTAEGKKSEQEAREARKILIHWQVTFALTEGI